MVAWTRLWQLPGDGAASRGGEGAAFGRQIPEKLPHGRPETAEDWRRCYKTCWITRGNTLFPGEKLCSMRKPRLGSGLHSFGYGSGNSNKLISRVYSNDFYRVDAARSREPEETGLGLASQSTWWKHRAGASGWRATRQRIAIFILSVPIYDQNRFLYARNFQRGVSGTEQRWTPTARIATFPSEANPRRVSARMEINPSIHINVNVE